ncbi:MAG TPA: SprT family zinc-dependent metalloprotease [Ramlibacter sp.]|nr:SprT family zinc-dependent metalloprotease [Ramlibacter sp.]
MRRLLQLTLDLFDAPGLNSPTAQAPLPQEAQAPPTQKPQPPSVDPSQKAPSPPRRSRPRSDAAPEPSLESLIEPAAFAHPRANRQVALGHTRVAYEFRRGRRRSIGFVVGPEGLTVSAPRWTPLYEVDAALQSKAGWIVRKLDEARERARRLDSSRIEWKDGASVPFLGESVIVVLDPRHGFDGVGAVLDAGAQALPGVARHTLHVGLSQHASPGQIRDAVQAWLMRQATRLFTERLEHFAPLLGVRWRKLALSSASTRWGTAHSDGTIRLNWRLIHFRVPVIDYVVAHELSHLRVMDHSPRFWDTVSTVVPDYAELRAQLKANPVPAW